MASSVDILKRDRICKMFDARDTDEEIAVKEKLTVKSVKLLRNAWELLPPDFSHNTQEALAAELHERFCPPGKKRVYSYLGQRAQKEAAQSAERKLFRDIAEADKKKTLTEDVTVAPASNAAPFIDPSVRKNLELLMFNDKSLMEVRLVRNSIHTDQCSLLFRKLADLIEVA
jgi:hypothetical protein